MRIKKKTDKAKSRIGLMRKLQSKLPRNALLTVFRKSFIRPHLGYSDIISDQPINGSFGKKLESVQYNAAVTITGDIKGTSREKLYKELGLESVKLRTTGLPTSLFGLYQI